MYLLDTNVLSEFRKAGSNRIDPHVAAWAEGVDEETMFMSVLSIFEIERGVLAKERHDPAQAAVMRRWLDERLVPGFAGRVLDVDQAVARRAAPFHVPDPKPHIDALLAATALVRGLTIVTRNVRHFEPLGVALLNPWEWVQ